jgi:hypothetical protein
MIIIIYVPHQNPPGGGPAAPQNAPVGPPAVAAQGMSLWGTGGLVLAQAVFLCVAAVIISYVIVGVVSHIDWPSLRTSMSTGTS